MLRPAPLAIVVAAAWLIWWVLPERPLRTLVFHGFGYAHVTMSPDAEYAFIDFGSGLGNKALLRLADGKEILPRELLQYEPNYLDNHRAIFRETDEDKTLRLADLAAGKVLAEFENVILSSWSRKGSIILYSEGADVDQHTLSLVTAETAATKQAIQLTNATGRISFDATGTRMVSLMQNDPSAIAIWDARDGRLLKTLRSAGSQLDSVEFCQDGKKIVALMDRDDGEGNSHTAVYFGDINDDVISEPILLRCGLDIHSGVFDPRDRYIIAHRYANVADLWDITKNPPVRTPTAGVPFFDPTGRRYLVGVGYFGMGGSVDWTLYDAQDHRQVYHFGDIGDSHRSSKFSPNGKWLAFAPKRTHHVLEEWYRRIVGRSFQPFNCFDVFDLDRE